MALQTVVVVGASLAGLRATEALRRDGFDGRIVLVGAEPHLPYDRPPLSKQLLAGEWEPQELALRRRAATTSSSSTCASACAPPRSTRRRRC